jgi:PAS domain S-box-containing protein
MGYLHLRPEHVERLLTFLGRALKLYLIYPFCIFVLVCLAWAVAFHRHDADDKADKTNIVYSNDVYFPPYVFIEDGKPTGFAVELIRNLGMVTGRHVDVRLEPWADVLPELRTGKIDVTSANISRQRLKEFDFSVPIAEVHYILFVRKGSRIHTMGDAKGKVIAAHRGDITYDFLQKSHVTSRIMTFPENEDGLRLLNDGHFDAAFAPRLQGLYFIRKFGLHNIEATDAGLAPMEYAFAVRKGNSALLRNINEGLGVLKENGIYRELYDKWFGVYEAESLYYRLRYYFYAAGLVLILLIVIFLWSWSLRRQVRARTMALTEEVQHRQTAEEALRDANQKLRALIESSPIAIMTLDLEGRIAMWNPAAERIFGWTDQEVLGRVPPSVPKSRLEEFYTGLQRTLQGEVLLDFETERVTRHGSLIDVSISTAALYDASGRIYGYLSLAADITEQKRADAHKKEFYQKTILAATDGKLVITDLDEIERISGPAIATLEIRKREDIGDIRAKAQKILRDAGMDENRISDFVLCIGEATTNVYKHVGIGTASMHRLGGRLTAVISDHGPGINAINLPEVALKKSYTTAVSLGMGYKAMISVADKIYLSTGPTGTVVAIEMNLQKPEATPAIDGLPDTW